MQPSRPRHEEPLPAHPQRHPSRRRRARSLSRRRQQPAATTALLPPAPRGRAPLVSPMPTQHMTPLVPRPIKPLSPPPTNCFAVALPLAFARCLFLHCIFCALSSGVVRPCSAPVSPSAQLRFKPVGRPSVGTPQRAGCGHGVLLQQATSSGTKGAWVGMKWLFNCSEKRNRKGGQKMQIKRQQKRSCSQVTLVQRASAAHAAVTPLHTLTPSRAPPARGAPRCATAPPPPLPPLLPESS